MIAQQLLNGLIVGGVYALFALGFTLVFGIQKILNLAHGAIFTVGAFTAYYIVAAGLPLVVGILGAIVVSGLLSVLVEFVCFSRLRKSGNEEFGAIISSIGAGLVIMTIAQRVSNTRVLRFPFETFPVKIYQFAGLRISLLQLFMVGCAVLLVAALWVLIYRTSFGRRIRAVTDNARAATLVGINPNAIYRQVYFISGALAGVAGVLVGVAFNSIHFAMGEPYLLFAFVIVILGGLGSVLGATVAALLFGMLQTLTIAFLPSGLTNTIIFLALFLILMVRPNGLFGKEAAGSLRGRR